MSDRENLITLMNKWEGNIPLADYLLSNGVIPVVRCNNCAVPHNKWLGCPNLNGLVPPPDFYCAYGERRSND